MAPVSRESAIAGTDLDKRRRPCDLLSRAWLRPGEVGAYHMEGRKPCAPGHSLFQQLLIVPVMADPEPCNALAFQKTQGAKTEADASRVDRLRAVHTLKLQSRMPWIAEPKLVGASGIFSHFRGQIAVKPPELSSCSGPHFPASGAHSISLMRPSAMSRRASSAAAASHF
jgi:hypothetical protein